MTVLENELLHILESVDDGYWYGWDNICETLEIGEKKAREAMYSLKAQGFVRAMPIFTDSLMLNGKGWFKLNPPSPNKE